MTPEQLQSLISNGETLQVEFKGESQHMLSDSDLIETVVCLANTQGHDTTWLIIGVEDSGEITGARKRHNGTTQLPLLQALIANRTRPALTCKVEIISLQGKSLL
jgi:Predicted transcriptional regulator containing an HTH domain and an uncharacterized domain shared with the mammalian protein Schlafen